MTRWPPATSVSLLAVATTLPAASAARTGRRLTIAAGRDDDEVDVVAGRDLGEASVAVGAGDGARRGAEPLRPAPSSDGRAFGAGGEGDDLERVRMGAEHVERLRPDRAGRAEDGDAHRPRGRRASAERGEDIQSQDGRREQERVDPVEDAAVAGDQRARVLRAGGPLEHRLGEVAGLGRERDERTRGAARRRGCLAEPDEDDGADRGRGDDPADQPGVRLRRRDVGQELAAARSACR